MITKQLECYRCHNINPTELVTIVRKAGVIEFPVTMCKDEPACTARLNRQTLDKVKKVLKPYLFC